MSEAIIGRYWCHQCNQVVLPELELELELKCPVCDGGFVEEMGSRGDADAAAPAPSDRSLSLWAPILLEMLGGSSRRSRFRREENDDDPDVETGFEGFVRRRNRTSAILQVLQSIRDEHGIDTDDIDARRERERERERRESLVLINPFHEAFGLQGSSNTEHNQADDLDNTGLGMSLGDYFLGPGLDLLLQHLAENDPNRYGTPPAKKEAVDALPTVKIDEPMSCSVCLDDFAAGTEAKEMPCKHKFHNECILPWLELHSSCPVCRFQLPADESKVSNGSNDSSRAESSVENGDDENNRNDRDNNGFWVPVPLPWPFNGLLSLSVSENGGNSSSNPSSSSSSNSRENSHSED